VEPPHLDDDKRAVVRMPRKGNMTPLRLGSHAFKRSIAALS
jgi:hypothetical protein